MKYMKYSLFHILHIKLYNVGSGPHVTNWLISFSVKENKGLWGMKFLPTT